MAADVSQLHLDEEAEIIRAEKSLLPGTMGWHVDDLDDEQFDRAFAASDFEISDGVVTVMPPAYYDGSVALNNLNFALTAYLRPSDPHAALVQEVDLVVAHDRIVKADAIYLTAAERAKQAELKRQPRDQRVKLGRIVVPPTLVVESVSLGHEQRDRVVKFEWYRAFGVPNYWVLDALHRTLDCFRLVEGRYETDVSARDDGIVMPSCFPGFAIPLGSIWLQEG